MSNTEKPTEGIPATGLRGPEPLKLGMFCLNIGGGASMSEAADQQLSWDRNVEVAVAADEAGWDFVLPLGRWRGLGGKINPSGSQFESFTWAAAIAAVTKRMHVASTCHVPLTHPIVAAKQGTTIDHVSHGRFAVNIVVGWNEAEFGMFRVKQWPHDQRYDAADEWLSCIEKLWAESSELEFEGTYYTIHDGYLSPKPVQRPRPVVISAGASSRGLKFALERADFNFIGGHNLESLRTVVEHSQAVRAEIGGKAEPLTHGPVVVRDTEAEAKRYFEWYVDQLGDKQAALGLAHQMIDGGGRNLPGGGRVQAEEKPKVADEVYERLARGLIAGWGGLPFVGTADKVASDLVQLSEMGVRGVAMSWVDYMEGFQQFEAEVVPLLREAGLRSQPAPASISVPA